MNKASENMAWRIIDVFIQENIFNELPNTLVIPNHFPAALIIKVRTYFISSSPLEIDIIDTCVGLKTFCSIATFSLLKFISSVLQQKQNCAQVLHNRIFSKQALSLNFFYQLSLWTHGHKYLPN